MDIDAPEWGYPPNRMQYDELKRRITNAKAEVEDLELYLKETYETEPDKDTRKELSLIFKIVARIKNRLDGRTV